jgi:hypothetical protein
MPMQESRNRMNQYPFFIMSFFALPRYHLKGKTGLTNVTGSLVLTHTIIKVWTVFCGWLKSIFMFFLQLPFEGLSLIVAFIIGVIGLVAVANGRFYDNTTKLCWFFIILFLNIIGILLFVFWGRKEVAAPEKNKT